MNLSNIFTNAQMSQLGILSGLDAWRKELAKANASIPDDNDTLVLLLASEDGAQVVIEAIRRIARKEILAEMCAERGINCYQDMINKQIPNREIVA